MFDKNLAVNISFMADAIIEDIDNLHPETWELALALTFFSWNNSIKAGSVKKEYYEKEIRRISKIRKGIWQQLITDDAEELTKILNKRKALFFEEDRRMLKECFFNILQTVSATEDNEEETLHVEPRF